MLRITTIETPKATTLKLEGNLAGPWVDELRQCWAKAIETGVPVEIDLRSVVYSDASGTASLLGMERRGTRLFGGSAFIDTLLHGEPVVRTARASQSCKKES